MRYKSFVRATAVIWSVVLASGFVYVRAGGTLWLVPRPDALPTQAAQAPKAPPRTMQFFSGSKSAAIAAGEYAPPSQSTTASPRGPTTTPQPASRATIISSSKSIILTPPQSVPSGVGQSQSAVSQPAAPRSVLFSGSKSYSGSTTIGGGPLYSAPNPPPATSSPAASEKPRRSSLMYSSKSAPIMDRSAPAPVAVPTYIPPHPANSLRAADPYWDSPAPNQRASQSGGK